MEIGVVDVIETAEVAVVVAAEVTRERQQGFVHSIFSRSRPGENWS